MSFEIFDVTCKIFQISSITFDIIMKVISVLLGVVLVAALLALTVNWRILVSKISAYIPCVQDTCGIMQEMKWTDNSISSTLWKCEPCG